MPWGVQVVETTPNLSQRLTRLPDLQLVNAAHPGIRCDAQQLQLRSAEVQQAADQYAQVLVILNISGSSCSIRGYPSVELVSRRGVRLPEVVEHGAGYAFVDHGPEIVTLAPRGTASFAYGGAVMHPRRHKTCKAVAVVVRAPQWKGRLKLALGRSLCMPRIDVSAIGPGPDSPSATFVEPTIVVNDRVRYQRFTGVGAAMTDTSAWLIYDELSAVARARVMRDLYGPHGIHLRWALVPMGASDFTRTGQPYSYDDLPIGESDPDLSHFSIAHDLSYIVPTLRELLALNPQAQIFTTPWSPPAWMKANAAFDDVGLAGKVLPSAYDALARYFVDFIRAYAGAGIPISAIAPVNEPLSGAPFPATSFPEPDEDQWIAQHLEPALRAAGLDPRIYGYDDGWRVPSYPEMLVNGESRTVLSGIAWHCYKGSPGSMTMLHDIAPSLDELVTECSPGISPFAVPEVLIASFRNWASGVLLWNVALDPSGGPVQPPNASCHECTGIATISEQKHTAVFTPTYYQLGQLSKFVERGAHRIASDNFVTYYTQPSGRGAITPGLDDVAFANPDHTRVTMVYNNSPLSIVFRLNYGRRTLTYELGSHATVTLEWNRSG